MGAGQLLQHAEPEILDIKNRELTGTLTLYSHPSLVQCLLLPRIGDFIAQHPTIHLNILTGQEIINTANRGVDLAMYFGKLPSGRHLDEAFMQESMVPICTPQYAAAHSLYDAPENGPLHAAARSLQLRRRRVANTVATLCAGAGYRQ